VAARRMVRSSVRGDRCRHVRGPGNFTVIGSLTFVGPVAVVVACVVIAVALAGFAENATQGVTRWLAVAVALALLTVAAVGSFVLFYAEVMQDAGPVAQVLATDGSVRVEIDKTPADARTDSVVLRSGSGPLRHETWLCAVDGDLQARVNDYAVVLTDPFRRSERTILVSGATVDVLRDTGGPADPYYCS